MDKEAYMKSCIRAEMYKAFHNKAFFVSLAIGLTMAAADILQNFIDMQSFPGAVASPGGYDGVSLFVNWIGLNAYTLGHKLLLFTWPLLAALPFGWSLFSENKSRYSNQIIARVGKSSYLLAKAAASFVAGGSVLFIPVAADLLLNALVCPACIPEVITHVTAITSGYFLSEMYYTQPWLFCAIWSGVIFLWGGVTATVCLAAAQIFKHSAVVVIFPYVLYLVWTFAVSFISGLTEVTVELSPIYLFSAAPYSSNPAYVIFTEMAAIMLVSMAVLFICEKKHENI